MKTRTIALVLFSLLVLGACNGKQSQQENVQPIAQESMEVNHTLVGKKAILEYPDFRAEVNYISESALHWKTTDAKGKVAEGDEKISYKQLNATQFFVNWIEQDGLTVSQVIDVKEGTVVAYLSYSDNESDRGKRSANFMEGKWQEIK